MSSLQVRPPLRRPRHSVIGGVSVGLADHLRTPVEVVRIAFVCLVFVGGAGALFYLWLWAFVPVERSSDAAITRRVPLAAVLAVLAGLAVLAELAALGSRSAAGTTFTLLTAVVAGGGAVAWTLTMDAADPLRSQAYGVAVRTASTFVLLLAGIAVLLSHPNGYNAVLGLVAIMVAVGVLIAPRMVTIWGDLLAERSARARDEQRAEIAAHLHDSVLQTLALIQSRAGATSEVARIARAQERELRDWLFADDVPAAQDLATELRVIAAAIELDYAVRIDVVTVGSPVEYPPSALVGASREAMLNAARHAGGDVAVYVEASDRTVDVFVRDRGPGVHLAELPTDRLGIRESIIGRMARAGGVATVSPGAGGGTEVHLHLEGARD